MKLKQWLIGIAGAAALGLLALPADAAPLGGATQGTHAPADAAVHKAFWWGHGGHRRHYREPYYYGGYYRDPYYYRGYRPHYYYYGAPDYYYAPRRLYRHWHHHRRDRW